MAVDENSFIRSSRQTGEYRIAWQGREISRNESVFYPVDENKIAFYSKTDAKLRYCFPEGFDGKIKEVYEITEEGRKAYENFAIWENSVEVDVRGGYPVMVRIY